MRLRVLGADERSDIDSVASSMLLAEALSWDLVSFLTGVCDTATGSVPDSPRAVLAAAGVPSAPMRVCNGSEKWTSEAAGATSSGSGRSRRAPAPSAFRQQLSSDRSLQGKCLGPKGAAALAEGLKGNSTLTSLKYAAQHSNPDHSVRFCVSAP